MSGLYVGNNIALPDGGRSKPSIQRLGVDNI